ncbi:MAG: hypothetical protein ACKN94_07590, partial [Pirellulaceae bacterium]
MMHLETCWINFGSNSIPVWNAASGFQPVIFSLDGGSYLGTKKLALGGRLRGARPLQPSRSTRSAMRA